MADCKEETLDRLRHSAFGFERQCSELPSHSTKRPQAVWERSEDLWKTHRIDVQKIGCTVQEGESPDPTDIAILTQEMEERNPHTVNHGTRESLERGSCSAWGSYKSQWRKPRLTIPGSGCTVTALSDWTGRLRNRECYIVSQLLTARIRMSLRVVTLSMFQMHDFP